MRESRPASAKKAEGGHAEFATGKLLISSAQVPPESEFREFILICDRLCYFGQYISGSGDFESFLVEADDQILLTTERYCSVDRNFKIRVSIAIISSNVIMEQKEPSQQ